MGRWSGEISGSMSWCTSAILKVETVSIGEEFGSLLFLVFVEAQPAAQAVVLQRRQKKNLDFIDELKGIFRINSKSNLNISMCRWEMLRIWPGRSSEEHKKRTSNGLRCSGQLIAILTVSVP